VLIATDTLLITVSPYQFSSRYLSIWLRHSGPNFLHSLSSFKVIQMSKGHVSIQILCSP